MTEHTTAPTASPAAHAGKYITFVLGHESYGVPARQVREIIRLVAITAMPQMPAFVKGVINLRGKIIPVADLRACLGVAESQNTERACIIVVQVQKTAGAPHHVGMIVDAVEEVANISSDEIEEPPAFGGQPGTRSILGLAKLKGSIKTLLNIDQLLAQAANLPPH